MLLHLVIIAFLTVSKTYASEELNVELIKIIVEHTFIGKYSNLHYIGTGLRSEKSNISHLVDSALMEIKENTYFVVDSTNTKETYKSMAQIIIFEENLEQQNLLQYIPDHILGENIRALIFFEGNFSNYISQFEDIYPLGSEIIMVSFYAKDTKFQIQSSFTVCVYLVWNEKLSCANNTKNSDSSIDKVFNENSWRPKPKREVVVETFNCPPFVLYNEFESEHSGIEYNILREITKNWPLRFNIVNDSNSAKSKWNIVIESVLNEKADIAMCSLWIKPLIDLFSKVSITYPLVDTCVTLVVPKPKVLPDISYIFQPVQLNLWIFLIVFVLITSLLLRLYSYFSTYQQSFLHYMYNTIRILTTGSVPTPPSSSHIPSLQYVAVSLSIISLLLSTAYSAGYISLLTNPRLVEEVLYLEDVVNFKIKIDIDVGGVEDFQTFLKKFENPSIRKLSTLVASPETNRRIDTKDFARVVKLIGQKYVSDTESFDEYKKTHLRLLKECIFNSYSSFVLRRHSKYTPFFNKMLMRLNEHGFITHWYRQSTINPRYSYMNNFFSSYVTESKEHVPLTVSKLKGAFLMLGVGLMLALLIFFCEIKSFY